MLHRGELLLACEDGTIRRHLVDDGTQATLNATSSTSGIINSSGLPDTIIRESSSIQCLAVSPDGELLAVGTIQGGLCLYRRETREFVRCLVSETPDADAAVRAVSFSSNGRLLAHTGRTGFVIVQDVDSGERKLEQQVGNGFTVEFLSNDRFVACGGQFENVRFFDVDTGTMAQSVVSANTYSLTRSPDDRWLVSTHSTGIVRVLDARLEKPPHILRSRFGSAESGAFSANSQTVISVDMYYTLRFADVETGEAFGALKLSGIAESAYIQSPQVHCSATMLAVTGYGDGPVSDLYLWSLKRLVR